jgi:hypothetical protein
VGPRTDHRKPIIAFAVLLVIACGLIGAAAKAVTGGLVMARPVGPSVAVHGTAVLRPPAPQASGHVAVPAARPVTPEAHDRTARRPSATVAEPAGGDAARPSPAPSAATGTTVLVVGAGPPAQPADGTEPPAPAQAVATGRRSDASWAHQSEQSRSEDREWPHRHAWTAFHHLGSRTHTPLSWHARHRQHDRHDQHGQHGHQSQQGPHDDSGWVMPWSAGSGWRGGPHQDRPAVNASAWWSGSGPTRWTIDHGPGRGHRHPGWDSVGAGH